MKQAISYIWICDKCGANLSEQEGFREESEYWVCKECKYINKIIK